MRLRSLGIMSVIMICALWNAPQYAQIPGLTSQSPWDMGGYVKYMATYSYPKEGKDNLDHLLHQRFNLEYRFDSGVSINLGLRNRVLMGDSLDLPYYSQYIERDSGYWDMSRNLVENDSVIVNSQLDRLFVDWQNDQWKARVGRFRINWAMNTVWNPNDLFNAYSIYDFDYEERAGSDAILVGRQIGFAGGVEAAFSPSRDSELNSAAARYYGNMRSWDYQLIIGKSLSDHVIGAGFATDVLGAGLRAELTWFDPTDSQLTLEQQNQMLVASSEVDYSFGGVRSWLMRVAWLYIDNPIDIANAKSYLGLPLSAKTLSFTSHTTYLDLSFDLTPLNRMTLSSSYYQDNSYFIGVSNSYSLANDWQFLTVLQHFGGRTKSLFGVNPTTMIFMNLKWSY